MFIQDSHEPEGRSDGCSLPRFYHVYWEASERAESLRSSHDAVVL